MAFPIGAIFAGDPIGHFNEEQRKQAKSFQDQLDQEASSLFGKTLQDMFQSAVPGAGPVPGGVPAVPAIGGQQGAAQAPAARPPAGAPPAAGRTPAAPAGPGGSILPFPAGGAPPQLLGSGSPGGPPAGPAQPPSGPAPGVVGTQGGQAGGGQQPQATGPLTLQQVIQSVVKSAGPKANPAVIAAAVQKFMPLMNAQSQQQARELMLQLRETTVQQGQERLNIQRDREDRLKDEEKAKQERWQKSDNERAQRLNATLARFDAAVRKQSVDEARQQLAEYDKLISERTTMASQLGISFPPEEVQAMLKVRSELEAKVNAMRAQPPPTTFNQRFGPPGSGVPPGPMRPQGGGADVGAPYAPPQ